MIFLTSLRVYITIAINDQIEFLHEELLFAFLLFKYLHKLCQPLSW